MNRRFLRPLTAILLAGGMLAATAVPVLAGTNGSSTQLGAPPASTCSVQLKVTAGAPTGFWIFASNTFNLQVTSYTPCGPGQPPTSCQVYITGAGPAPIEKSFSGPCTLTGSQKAAIGAWATAASNQYCTGTGVTSVTCAISNMLTALSSGNVVGTLIAYTTGAMGLPFYAQNGLTSWITTTHQNALRNVYLVMAFLGATVALLAAAFRVIADVGQRGTHVGLLIIGAPVRLFFALVLIASFFALAQWAIPIFNNLASGTYTAIMSNGVEKIFGVNGHMTVQAIVGVAGAGIAGLLSIIIALVMMIYLFVMFLFRDVILVFSMMIAPIAIGLGVYDHKNDLVMMWRNLFIGGLLMSLAGAVGVGVTFAIVGSLLQTAATGVDWLMAMIMMIGGLFFTTRLMNTVMRGSMSHRSPSELLVGMGEGAILGMGIRKAINHGSSTVAKARSGGAQKPPDGGDGSPGAGDGAPAPGKSNYFDGGGGPPGAGGSSPTGDFGVARFANPDTRKALGGLPRGSVETALANDPQARSVIERATKYMDPSASLGERMSEMTHSGVHNKVLNRMIETGTGKADLLAGKPPTEVRFNYNKDELDHLTVLADKAADEGGK